MDTPSLLTIIGTLASIIGACISIWQASRSKKSAEEAQRIRAQLVDHRKISELAQVQTRCRIAQKSMEKYGPGSTQVGMTGISPQRDAADVQTFLTVLKEHRAYFEHGSVNHADRYHHKLTALLDNFAQSSESEGLRKYGKQIVVHLDNISPVIKKCLENNREKVY